MRVQRWPGAAEGGTGPLPTLTSPCCLYWPSTGLLAMRGSLRMAAWYSAQTLASCLPAPLQRASSPSPAWAMHYPHKIEDLMEAISTRGSPSIQAREGGQSSASWLLCPP